MSKEKKPTANPNVNLGKPSEYVFLVSAKDEKSFDDSLKSRDDKPVMQIIPNPLEGATSYFNVPVTAKATPPVPPPANQTLQPVQHPIHAQPIIQPTQPAPASIQTPAKAALQDPSPQQQTNVPPKKSMETAEIKASSNQYEPLGDFIDAVPNDTNDFGTTLTKESPKDPKDPKVSQKSQQQKLKSKHSEKVKSKDASEKAKSSKKWQIKFWKSKPTGKHSEQKPVNPPAAKIDEDSDLQSKVMVPEKKKSAEMIGHLPQTSPGCSDEKTNLADLTPVESVSHDEQQHHKHHLSLDKDHLIQELFLEWRLLQQSNRRSAIILIIISFIIGLLLTVADVLLWITDFYEHAP